MFRNLRYLLAGTFLAAMIGTAFAGMGQTPVAGYQTPDGSYLLGLADGVNSTYQYGITAAGSTQAGATQLPSLVTLIEVDTAAASTGVALPPAYQGVEISLYNNGANTLTIYPNVNNNPYTSAQDTINNTTSITVSSHASLYFFCAKNGVWAAK